MTRERRARYLGALSVALFTFLIFLPALQNGFVNWDDDEYVYANYHIRSFDPQFFRWAFLDFHSSNWHPLTWMSHALDYAVWGLAPAGHHLSSILIHSVNSFLVVMLALRLLQAVRKSIFRDDSAGEGYYRETLFPAVVAGLLFGIHPVHVESVAWVSERKDVLCACFYLLSLLSYTGYAAESSGHRKGRYALSLAFFVLALLSKPMAVSLPIVLLILDWYPFGRIRRGTTGNVLLEKLPFFLLSAASSFITLRAQQAGKAVVPLVVIPLYDRVIVTFYAVASYVAKLLFPVGLLPLYPYPKHITLSSPRFFVPVLAVLGVSLFCMASMRRRKAFAAVWGFFLVTLLPVLGIVQVGSQAMADRYLYIPSIGPFLLAAVGGVSLQSVMVRRVGRKPLVTTILFSGLATILIVLSMLSVRQIRTWKDDEIFWGRVVEAEPGVAKAYNNLGIARFRKGDVADAAKLFEEAIRLDPLDGEALNNLAICLLEKGRYDEAIPYAVRASSGRKKGDAFNTLGEIYLAKDDPGRAAYYFRKALSLDRTSPTRNYNLALTLEKTGEKEEACAYWKEYLRLGSNFPDAAEVSLHMKEMKCP